MERGELTQQEDASFLTIPYIFQREIFQISYTYWSLVFIINSQNRNKGYQALKPKIIYPPAVTETTLSSIQSETQGQMSSMSVHSLLPLATAPCCPCTQYKAIKETAVCSSFLLGSTLD